MPRDAIRPLGFKECEKLAREGLLDLMESWGRNKRGACCKCCGGALQPGAGMGRAFFTRQGYRFKTRYLCAACDKALRNVGAVA